jgi:hypothetical protein
MKPISLCASHICQKKGNEMGRICSTHFEENCSKILIENPKVTDHSGDLDMNINYMGFKTLGLVFCGFIWFGIGSNGGLL